MTSRPWQRIGVVGACVLACLITACSASTKGDDGGKASESVLPVHGVTADTIKIGFSVSDPKSTVNTGAKGVGIVDERAEVNAVLAYANEHGGIAGRKVEAVFKVHGAQEDDASVALQADCSAFTEDSQVFAVYSARLGATPPNQLADCLAKRGTMLLIETNMPVDNDELEQWAPYAYAPGSLSVDRWQAYVDELVNLSYFGANAKVGLVTFDNAVSHQLVDQVTAALTKHSISVGDAQYMTPYTNTAGYAQDSSQLASMVLRFKSEGIDHVMLLGTGGVGGFIFPTAAEAQKYRPRYAFSSIEFPNVIADNVPKAQLKDAVGVGWDPGFDVAAAQDPGDNKAQQRCFDIYRSAGVTFPDRASSRRALGVCTAVFFLQAALKGVNDPSAQAVRKAVDSPNFHFQSAETYQVSFTGGRYDGVAALRGMTLDTSCSCWKYAGAWQPVP